MPSNHHATVLLVGDRGVMLRGPSGAGKTTLALTIMDQARMAGFFARLVSDDQIFLRRRGGKIVAEAPKSIGGLIELRGFGPVPADFEPWALIDLVVDLVEPGNQPRYQPQATTTLLDLAVANLVLDAENPVHGARAIIARLGALTSLAGNLVPSDASN